MVSKRLCGSRTQFPIRIAYVITTHKGDILESGVICLEKFKGVWDKHLYKIILRIIITKNIEEIKI